MAQIEIKLRGYEEAPVKLGEIVNFLYDFNIAYELSRLATDPMYEGFVFSHYALFRKGRPLRSEDRMVLQKLQHNSPLEMAVTIATTTASALASIWVCVQIYDRIGKMPLERRKLELDITNAELKLAALLKETREPAKRHRRRIELRDEEEFLVESSHSAREIREAEEGLRAFKARLRERDADDLIESVERRFESSPVKIGNIRIDVVPDETKTSLPYKPFDE